MQTLQSWATDAQNAAWVVFGVGIVGAIACGFAWIAFLRVCTKCIVWGTIVGFCFLLACLAAYCWLMTGYFDTTAIAEWVSAAAAAIGLDGVSAALDTWLNETDFSNQNVSGSEFSVTAELGVSIQTDTQTLWRVGTFVNRSRLLRSVVLSRAHCGWITFAAEQLPLKNVLVLAECIRVCLHHHHRIQVRFRPPSS